MNIKQALRLSENIFTLNDIPSASLDAEVLLLETLNRSGKYVNKSWLYVNSDYKLSRKEEKLFNKYINQRKNHKPIAYITNKKEFYGYEFYVDENVLIPRVETEFMIEEVIKIISKNINSKNKINLIDIGSGSGCIMISILNELKKNKINKIIKNSFINEISSKAIKISRYNAKKYNLEKEIKFINKSFEDFIEHNKSIFTNQFIITANLPYIKKNDYNKLAINVKTFEPKNALVGGINGLELIEELINLISKLHKNSNSKNYILFEADPAQIIKIKQLLQKKLNAIEIKIIKDLRGKNRLILAKI